MFRYVIWINHTIFKTKIQLLYHAENIAENCCHQQISFKFYLKCRVSIAQLASGEKLGINSRQQQSIGLLSDSSGIQERSTVNVGRQKRILNFCREFRLAHLLISNPFPSQGALGATKPRQIRKLETTLVHASEEAQQASIFDPWLSTQEPETKIRFNNRNNFDNWKF